MTHRLSVLDDGTVCIDGTAIEPVTWRLGAGGSGRDGRPVTPREAFGLLARTASLRHLVVGVIGPRDATPAQEATAEAVGRALGALGLTTICGGRSGVMEGVARGCSAAGGLVIGILPGSTPDEANPHIGIPLPTGLGEARNMIIAKAARVLIAVGGSYGTLSEVAYGLHFSKAVIGLEGAPEVDGVRHAESVEAALDMALLALALTAETDGRA